jgi:hypothetical protein
MVVKPRDSETVLSPYPKEADANDNKTVKTSVARGNYGFKTGPNHLTSCTVQ